MQEPQSYDLYAKAVLKDIENLKALLFEFLPQNILKYLDLEQLSFVPEEQISLPKEKRLLPDLIVQVPFQKHFLQLYILIEHKSYQDLGVYSQILNYLSALFEKNLKEGIKPIPVLPFIFYHGKRPWLYPVRFVELFSLPKELRPYFLDYQIILLDLIKLSDEELLKRVEIYEVFYTFLYLVKNLDKPLEELLRVILRFVGLIGELSERDRWYVELFILMVSRCKGVDEEEILSKMREMGGEEVMREIKVYSERKYEQGIQQGIQQGIMRGLVMDAQELVIEALEERFGEVKEEIKLKIKAIEDREKLKRLHRLAIRVSSLEEFKKELY